MNPITREVLFQHWVMVGIPNGELSQVRKGPARGKLFTEGLASLKAHPGWISLTEGNTELTSAFYYSCINMLGLHSPLVYSLQMEFCYRRHEL